jgi:hypothetical protein
MLVVVVEAGSETEVVVVCTESEGAAVSGAAVVGGFAESAIGAAAGDVLQAPASTNRARAKMAAFTNGILWGRSR